MAVAVVESVVFTGKGFKVETDESGVSTLWLQLSVKDAPIYDPAEILPAVQERIDSGKKPAGVLSKSLERIYHHTEQLCNAVSTLFETYDRMVSVQPRTRVSAAYKARFSLFDNMKNKMLKEYALDYIPDEVDNYILTDASEREALIRRLCDVMVEEKEDNERTEAVEG